ncbi:MAG: ABC transporter substrate-binding protein [Pseudomonadota bacterium]
MTGRTIPLTLITTVLVVVPLASAVAIDFRWSSQAEPSTLDPHAAATAPVLGFLNNVYEGLVRRAPDMRLEPSLAVAWEPIGDQGWRFRLREGVRFQDGATFDADDVIFSYERASSDVSDVKAWFSTIDRVEAPDSLTVEFYTTQPDPLFPSGIANWMIMDRGWTEAIGAELPSRDTQSAATFEANGTGPFRVVTRNPDVTTTLQRFDGWWDTLPVLETATFKPLASDATRVAALLSGEVDLIEPVPLQDVPKLERAADVSVITGVESRVIFFGFDHLNDGPLTDPLVREAIYRTLDADAIVATIMRGQAQAAGLLIGPGVQGYRPDDDQRLPTDRDAARGLLAEAGHGDGFPLRLRCPNDRYVNDEAICTAAIGMLRQIGIDASLDAVPVSVYWDELRAGRFDMYLLGWSPGTFDAEHPIRFLLHSPDPERRLGSWNFGGFTDADIDALLPRIQREIDPVARQAMLDEVHARMRERVAYVPMHVQPLVWAVRAPFTAVQRPDNFLILRWIGVR